jgi:hypothetical protein
MVSDLGLSYYIKIFPRFEVLKHLTEKKEKRKIVKLEREK